MPSEGNPLPSRKPIREFQTPNPVDGYFSELISLQDPNYQLPPKRGTLYSTVKGSDSNSYPGGVAEQFPLLYFCREIRFKESPTLAVWLWATDPAAEDTYNAEISYMEGLADYPAFTRSYTVRRDVWDAAQLAETQFGNGTVGGIIGTQITNEGIGYENPQFTTGVAGTGAAFMAILSTTGQIVSIIVTKEGSNYTSSSTLTITDSGPGAGATAVLVIQPSTAICIEQRKVEFPEDHPLRNEYVKVIKTYRTLDGPTRTEYDQDDETQVASTITMQEIKGSEVVEPTPTLGRRTRTKWINNWESDLIEDELDAAQMASFYRVFVGNASLDLPRVLIGMNIVWSSSTAAGTYSETGSGEAVGASAALSETAQGRAQGSAAVLPELVPQWAPHWTADLTVFDFFFFLPANATEAEILAAASAFATLWFGTAVTIDAWPVFSPVELNFSIAGQKISVSVEVVVRCSVSIVSDGSGGTDASASSSTGQGTNQDVGDSIRPVNIPGCLCAGILLQQTAMSETVSCEASATLTAGSNFPGGSASLTISGTAVGYVTPTNIPATAQGNYPLNGFGGKISSQEYKRGYAGYRVRVFDWAILPHQAMTQLIDFAAMDGTAFTTGGTGLSLILSLNNNTLVIGAWFFVSAETQPNLSAFNVTAYLKVTVGSGDTAAQCAADLITALNGTYSTNAAYTNVNGQGTLTAVQVVDDQPGPENPAQANDSGTTITVQAYGY